MIKNHVGKGQGLNKAREFNHVHYRDSVVYELRVLLSSASMVFCHFVLFIKVYEEKSHASVKVKILLPRFSHSCLRFTKQKNSACISSECILLVGFCYINLRKINDMYQWYLIHLLYFLSSAIRLYGKFMCRKCFSDRAWSWWSLPSRFPSSFCLRDCSACASALPADDDENEGKLDCPLQRQKQFYRRWFLHWRVELQRLRAWLFLNLTF